ncbi:MAG: NAD(+) diphosphatase [Phormidesmis sp.]
MPNSAADLPQPLNRLQPFAIPNGFLPATAPTEGAMDTSSPAWWFVCTGSRLLTIAASGKVDGPERTDTLIQTHQLEDWGIVPVRTQFLGYLHNRPCIAAELPQSVALPKVLTLCHLRELYGRLSEDLFAIAARAVQLIEWDRTHQYCGHCATPTIQLPTERAKRCPQCQLRQYPRLSPAVIMLIYRGEEILLARAPRFRDGMYSVLAGFVEPGESLEETVAREVREEVGVEIKNIRYFGSQPWPFPNSLMVGFIAEYASGALTLEPTEIEAAAWFHKTDLPPVPGKLSIARKLIDWFVTSAI